MGFGVKDGNVRAFLLTPDTTAPTVDEASLSPFKLQTGVQRNTNITATFSEEMKLATLVTAPKDPADPTVGTSSNVTLEMYNKKKKKWQPVSGVEVSCNTPCDTATLNPFGDSTTKLLANTKYRVTITTGARDKADNALTNNFSWIFTTGKR